MGKKIVALLTILAIIFTVAIFTPDSNAGIQTLNLSKQTKEIKVGESFQLTMTGVKASSIKWKSSKPGVATVNKKGVIKGIKAGSTNITGKYKSLKFTIKVKVTGSSSESKAPDNQTDTPSTTKTDKYLTTCANVELYYSGIKGNYLYIKAVNKNNYGVRVFIDYINIDTNTLNSIGGSFEIMANNFRTNNYYFGDFPKPQNTISFPIEIWTSDYESLGKTTINISLK